MSEETRSTPREGQGSEPSGDTGAAQVPLHEQMEACLAHYEHLATVAHEWNNQVPQAIRAWYAAKDKPSEKTPTLSQAHPAPDASEPMVPNGEYRELQLGGSPKVTPLNCDRDAARWAREFNERLHTIYKQPPLDEGWLISWFANAMMCGEDTYRWRQEARTASSAKTPSIALPTEEEIAAYRDRFRAELDKNMNNSSASPSTDAHRVALYGFVERRNGGAAK